MPTVGELLLQVGEAHEAELKRATQALEEANQRLLKELEQQREGMEGSEGPEAPPVAPPKLIVQVVPAIGHSGSRVSFQEDDSPDRSPRSHCETFESEKSVHGTENEEATPRAESAPVPIPGVVEAEGPRRASAPLALARQASKQLTQDTSETVARLRIGTTMAAEQLESPPELKLAAAWRRKTSGTTSKVARTVSSKAHGHSLHDEEDENVFVRVLDRFVLDPSSAKRMAFEVLGLVLIVYDLFWLPMQVFDPPVTTFTEVMGWASSVYWLVDIPMSFLVGHITRGIIEMKVRNIARLYLRGWFWFDIIVVSVDWVLNILEVVNNTKNVGGISALRLGKGVRVLRVFRLIRVLKGGGILQELLDTIHSEHCVIIVGIVKLLGLILCVNHIIACLWFWVGSAEHENWIAVADITQRSIPYQYATCLHWSLTQFTPASMEVYPTNEQERFFCVCVIVSAMVIFSSFISAITNAMTQLRNLNKEKIEQFALLRKYLTQCNVSGGLLARVLQSVSSAMNKNKRRVHEEDIRVLQLLPLSLRQDMNQEVYSPYFVNHPFFSVCSSCFDTYVRKLYSTALKPKFLPSNQEIITSGEQATDMYFVINGTLNYKADRQASPLPMSITEGKWLSEAALWLFWQHNGIGQTASECDLVGLNAARFQETFKDDVTVKHYAVVFWSHFMVSPLDLSDAWAEEDLLFQWSTEALHLAEQCVGSVIQPDTRNAAFTRHIHGRRRSSSAMLDVMLQGQDMSRSSLVDSP